MSGNSGSSRTRQAPWYWWDPFGVLPRFAPHELDQPILPGWIFANAVTITGQNSSAPETEREIVAAESYGRQIGRMSDALAALVAEWPKGKPKPKEILDFLELRDRVEKIKGEVTTKRAEHFLKDMVRLKRDNYKEFRRLAGLVRRLETENGQEFPDPT